MVSARVRGRGAWLALAALFALRATATYAVALPLSLAVGDLVGGYPRGDAVLWDPGGVLLVEAAVKLLPRLAGVGTTVLLLAVGAAFAALLPLGALVAALGDGRRGALGRGAGCFGPLALLFGATVLAQVLAFALAGLLAGFLGRVLGATPEVVLACRLGGLALGGACVWFLALYQDLVRVAVVVHDLGLSGAWRVALGAWGGARWRTAAAFAWRQLLGVALAVLGVVLTLRGALPDSAAVGGAALVGAVTTFGALYLRASWLAWAIARLPWAEARERQAARRRARGLDAA
ncbi:MAG: hypothetical protein IT373_19205 [Polyangiaceae bacterium]|nr:hypothetical protein [Polyangiaceae bacterium]